MKPLTRYWNSDYMEAQPDGDWYAKDEADAVIRHYQDEALCAEEAAMTHAQRVAELEAERDAARADAERLRGHMQEDSDAD